MTALTTSALTINVICLQIVYGKQTTSTEHYRAMGWFSFGHGYSEEWCKQADLISCMCPYCTTVRKLQNWLFSELWKHKAHSVSKNNKKVCTLKAQIKIIFNSPHMFRYGTHSLELSVCRLFCHFYLCPLSVAPTFNCLMCTPSLTPQALFLPSLAQQLVPVSIPLTFKHRA